MLLLLLACHNEPSAPTPTALPALLLDTPSIRLVDDDDAFLVGEVQARTSRPTQAILHVDDPCGSRTITFPGTSTEHVLPLLGLHAGAAHAVQLELVGDTEPLFIDLGTLETTVPPDLPPFVVNVLDPDRVEPTLLFVPVRSVVTDEWLVALDPAMHVVYALRGEIEQAVHDPTDGTWVVMDHEGVFRRTMLGDEVERWSSIDDRWSHEVQLLPDGGLLSLQRHFWYEEEYPTDIEFSGTRSAQLSTDQVVRLDAAHEVVESHSVAPILDTRRIGYLSVSDDDPQDWSHVNAAVPWGDDAYLVSVRHLDVILCMNRDGTVRWLLGDPTAWESPWAEAFLQPVGPIQWPRQQHAVEVHGDQVVMFDNGNFGGSPYAPGPVDYEPESRGAAFLVDEAARTVTADWSLTYKGLFTGAMGDTDVLPATGNVQITFANLNRPIRHARIVQLHPDRPDEPALDVQVGLDVPRFVYRTLWGPSLYPADVRDER